MAKIVIDARRIRTTTGRYVYELLEHLKAASPPDGGNGKRETGNGKQDPPISGGNEYHVIIHEKDQGTWAPEKAKNFYVHVTKYDHYTFGEQLGFARFLYKLKPDLVHFTMPQQPLLYFGKRITTVHDLTLVRFKNLDKNRLVYWIEQTIFKFLLKNVARRSKVVITPTKFVKEDLARYAGVDKNKIVVTYEAARELGNGKRETENRKKSKRETGNRNAGKKTELRAPISELRNKQFIFYVGNAFPHKNLYRLVDAHQRLLEKYPVLHLAIAGKKEFFHEQLESYTSENEYRHVHHLGFVSDEELSWLYEHAAAYVFPSLSEGFGLPGLEVMQHGVPLVSSNATCLPEVYGDAAHYFDPLDTDSMVEAIDEVLRSKTRRQQLVKAGGKQLAKYSWSATAEQTLKQYEAVVENGK